MGVKNLWDILESCKKTLPLHHLQNKRVCVDLSCWMVQLQNVNKSYCANKEKLHLRGLFHRLRALIALNCSIILVTDGSVPAIKLSTYRRRLNSGCEDGMNSQVASSLKRNKGSEFSCMIKEAKLLGLALGIPCLDGIEEAEAQCALLNSESLCDGCFTSDSDIFLFGARTVYRDICLGDGGYVVCYEMADIETKLGFGRNSLITFALLLGGDYSQGVHGLGQESACQIVKSVGDEVVLRRIASEGLSFVKKSKNSKKPAQLLKCANGENAYSFEPNTNGSDLNSKGENQFLQVINAYLKPKCHPAGSDAVYRVLAQHPFQHAKLQEICAQWFEWPPEKTDDYILSKIAERELRRFAFLRSISSELGVKLPLDKIPVKCPVSEIIKSRKIQGKECFEVSWKEFDGLKTSIVPADVIKSACPEKIKEFEEIKAMGKKKQNCCKPRQKKSKNRLSSLPEVTLELQNLVLGVEPESYSSCSTSISSKVVIPENINAINDNVMDKHSPHVELSVREADSNATRSCHPANHVPAENKIIDLLSPPQAPSRNVYTFQERKQSKHNNSDRFK
ncbi:flap endonuclease GEN-like 2 [Carica papaya]|uniref:flap endonuclease GEN-like 2 n=1 Tax=Carica papaya TaxID=3649 RepID=UPI000B8D088F|nr:flap endonuclease GEN-like 2 [Carica papaya]